jgi:predicted outer membrane repeat protein
MRFATGIRFAAVLALVLGFSLAGLDRAAASHVPITIHAMECYTGVGSAIFEECHNEIESGSYVTDDSGGTATLVVPEDVLALYLGAYIYCRDLTDDEVLFDGNYADTGGGAAFAVEDGDEIVCDVYLITPAPKDDGGYDGGYDHGSSYGGTTTVTTLPATGAGPGGDGSSQGMLLFVGLLAVVATAFGVTIRRLQR